MSKLYLILNFKIVYDCDIGAMFSIAVPVVFVLCGALIAMRIGIKFFCSLVK